MARKIEKLTYTNERGESIVFSHASIYHTNEVSGLSDVRNAIYSINSMGQDGDTYLGNRIESREIEIVGSIRERDKDHMREYRRKMNRVLNPQYAATLTYEYGDFKRVIDCKVDNAPVFSRKAIFQDFTVQLLCLNPFWRKESKARDDIATWIGGLEFPEEIPLEEGWQIGFRQPSLIVNVYNDGDVQAGIRVEFRAEEWAEYFASFIGNGVFPVPSSGLQVVAGSGMAVTVKTGKAWINGYFYYNTGDLSVTLPTADGVLTRIDRIVVRWDLTERLISVVVKSSTPSASPSAPSLQRDADAYELCLADIAIGAGVTAISQANITDRRLDGALCGVVAGVVDQIDTDAFNAQLEAWFTDYKAASVEEFNDLVSYMRSLELLGDQQYAALQAYMNTFKQSAENDFNAWFASLQNVLDEDTAGHLLNLIQNNTARIELIEAVLFNDITANPFLILFDNLDGIVSTGVWNAALQRIEC